VVPADAAEAMAALRLCTASSFAGVPAVCLPTSLAGGLPAGVQLDAAEAIEERLGVLTPTPA